MKAKTTIIVPGNYDELIKMKHYLMGVGKPYKTVPVPMEGSESSPMMLVEMDIMERMLFKLSFGLRSERTSVLG